MLRTHGEFANLRIFDHPLIQSKLTRVRDRNTPSVEFRRVLNEIASLMIYEVSRAFATQQVPIDTPLEPTTGLMLSRPITLVPILRAGIGMCDGVLAVLPEARIGHLGIYRNEQSLDPVAYYSKLPRDIANGHVLLIDTMLATGGSACRAATALKENGCDDLMLLCLVCAPEGAGKMAQQHPDLVIYTAALDRQLNNKGYILPGLGDAGDRMFGTV